MRSVYGGNSLIENTKQMEKVYALIYIYAGIRTSQGIWTAAYVKRVGIKLYVRWHFDLQAILALNQIYL